MTFPLGILTDAFFIALLTWCAFTDCRKRIIPNLAIVFLFCLGALHVLIASLSGLAWWMYIAGLLLAVPFFIAWLKNSMGGGDVKLMSATALFLGLWGTLLAFVLMIPVFAVLIIYARCKHKTTKHRIPLAPVVAMGAAGAVAAQYICGLIQF